MTSIEQQLEELFKGRMFDVACAARDSLFRQHLEEAGRTALFVTRNQDDADEAVSEACVSANREFFSCRGRFGAWFRQIVRNKSIHLLRSRYEHHRRFVRLNPETADPDENLDTTDDSSQPSLGEIKWRLVDLRLQLVDLLHEFDQDKKQLFLAKITKLTTTEIAEHFGSTTGAVYAAWSRLHATITKRLGISPIRIWKGASQ